MTNNDDDKPIPERLKVVTVIDVVPGRGEDPEHGPPIGILRLAFKDDLEQPLMFRMDDVRRLAIGFMAIWAQYDKESVAQEIMEQYFVRPDRSVFGSGSSHKLNGTSPRDVTPVVRQQPPLPLSGIQVVASFEDEELRPITIFVHGGYASKATVMLVGHCDDFGSSVNMTVKILEVDKFILQGHSEDEVLRASEWRSFYDRKAGSIFGIGKRRWKKLDVSEIRLLLERKKFQIVSNRLPPKLPPKRRQKS